MRNQESFQRRRWLATSTGAAETLQNAPTSHPFLGLQTATPGEPVPLGEPAQVTGGPPLAYYTQQGDTLAALALRFGVQVEQISGAGEYPPQVYLPVGLSLSIPNLVGAAPYPSAVFPDSGVVNSPSAVGFDVQAFVQQAGGYLSTYTETLNGRLYTGAEIVSLVASEASIHPRLLLAFLEFRSGWVYGQPENQDKINYPIGFHVSGQRGLYRELVMTTTHLQIGYYGWRDGSYTEMKFNDGIRIRLSPGLNAGSIAVQNLSAKFYDRPEWAAALYGQGGFLERYRQMFGDPWEGAAQVEPYLLPDLAQPQLELPFVAGERWSLTGGPHPAWKTGSPRGALDFAPVTGEADCAVSRAWILASGSGLVVRSDRNAVVLDLDGDGNEQTGWVLLYFHVADKERILPGTVVEADAQLGHPSCEGGLSTGTHFHFARKYNGEWLFADGPLPLVLSGWETHAGLKNYQGEMIKGSESVVASPVGPRDFHNYSLIFLHPPEVSFMGRHWKLPLWMRAKSVYLG